MCAVSTSVHWSWLPQNSCEISPHQHQCLPLPLAWLTSMPLSRVRMSTPLIPGQCRTWLSGSRLDLSTAPQLTGKLWLPTRAAGSSCLLTTPQSKAEGVLHKVHGGRWSRSTSDCCWDIEGAMPLALCLKVLLIHGDKDPPENFPLMPCYLSRQPALGTDPLGIRSREGRRKSWSHKHRRWRDVL